MSMTHQVGVNVFVAFAFVFCSTMAARLFARGSTSGGFFCAAMAFVNLANLTIRLSGSR